MARMGQCFSTSLDAIGIDINEGTSWDMDEDIKTPNGAYCFSDGVGRISQSLVRQVRIQTDKLCRRRDVYQNILEDPNWKIQLTEGSNWVLKSRAS